jgi:hypothetical protein
MTRAEQAEVPKNAAARADIIHRSFAIQLNVLIVLSENQCGIVRQPLFTKEVALVMNLAAVN